MTMSNCYPLPKKFFRNEIHTLNLIKSNSIFAKHFKTLFIDAKEYLLRNDMLIKKVTAKKFKKVADQKFKFDFKSQINEILINGKVGSAYIEALVNVNNGNYDQFTYSVAFCYGKKIIRKYHFDYTPDNIPKRTRHPIFHLQYPGEISDYLEKHNLEYKHLNCELSEPRIPFTPMSLALLINLILKEFPDKNACEAIGDRTWRDLIKKNELEILEPYFRKCNTFFSNPPANLLFTNDYCYGLL